MEKKRRSPRWLILGLFLILLILLLLFLVKCGGDTESAGDGNEGQDRAAEASDFLPVQFVELIYEQSFRPLPETFEMPPEPEWPSPKRYFLQPLNGKLYTSDGRQEPLEGDALVARRLYFHHKLWPHSPDQFGELSPATEAAKPWRANQDPPIEAMTRFDAFCHLRLPMQVEVQFQKETVKVSGGTDDIELKPGETKVVVSQEKSYTVEELVSALNARLGLPLEGKEVTPDMLRQRPRLLGLDGEGSEGEITLYGRVVAVFHEGVQNGEVDLLALLEQGDDALLSGDVETALVRLQSLANLLPENRMVADQLAMALNPPELVREGVPVEGEIRYPGDPPEEVTLPPYVRATALDESGQDEIVYLEEPESYQIYLLPGRYRIEISLPGFEAEPGEITLKKGEPKNLNFTLTEAP